MALSFRKVWNDLIGEYNVGIFNTTVSAKPVDLQAVVITDSTGATGAAVALGTVDTELPAAAALADATANPTVPGVGAHMMGYNGTTWDRALLADVLTTDPAGTKKGVVTRNIPSGTQNTIELSGLMPKVYDYVSLGYTGSDLTTAVYKTGGAAGTTVATLAMTYSAGILQTVTRT